MVSEAKKLHIIEEVLKIDNEAKLTAIENFINKTRKNPSKVNIESIIGILSKEEADEMKKAIAETCDTIDLDAWK